MGLGTLKQAKNPIPTAHNLELLIQETIAWAQENSKSMKYKLGLSKTGR